MTRNKPKCLISLSGGLDSATLLSYLQELQFEVEAVSFQYGSKHNPYELMCAGALAEIFSIRHDIIDMTKVMQNMQSALLDRGAEIPEGHYEEESMRQTVVPGRNIIFASILSGLAMSRGIGAIALGVHAGDHYIYPDCRPDFAMAMRVAIEKGTEDKDGHYVTLLTPFLNMNKAEILKIGFSLGTPYEHTRTCYKAQAIACGKCGSCQERLAAFKEIDRNDPIDYVTRDILPKKPV